MTTITTYIKLWHYFKKIGYKTIEEIDSSKAWNFKLNSKEFTVKETFYHIL